MRLTRMPLVDNTLPLLIEGYGWMPNRRRRTDRSVVESRLMGRRAIGLCGPAAARFFYDEDHVQRHGAIPELIRGTLFGKGAVHTLDGEAHRHRKALFLDLMTPAGIADLADRAGVAWDETAASWPQGEPVVVSDETARVITKAVCRWAGVPLDDADVPQTAADLVATIDGFATLGPRHWRARRARGRQERWLSGLIDRIRSGEVQAPQGSALAACASHRERDGQLLDSEVAAVELLNVIRPTVAVCWFVAFAGHAMHRWPQQRAALREGDPAFVEAFAHEVRRFYPFAPFVGGLAVRDLSWGGAEIPQGSMVLLDIYGQNHDPELWVRPYEFSPARFVGRPIDAYELIPQGGGHPAAGHRCPGEGLTVALLSTLIERLAALDYDVPEQDLHISLTRIPAKPASGFVVRPRPGRPYARTGPAATSARTGQTGTSAGETGADRYPG